MQWNYQKINNLLGWGVFAVAAFTYLSTIEPTASFWDCGEYIATAVKLQVGHPPGAPLFQLIGNLFSQFAFGDVTKQAMMVNIMSATASALTSLFLFWTITAFGYKFARKHGEIDAGRKAALFGGALVGALTYTFSDSAWFSAVEGEVYAMSSMFTAMAIWSILKWQNEVEHSPRANRWLVLIAYLIGLSIGVHILVFLAIPAIVMVFFYKKYENKTISRNQFILFNVIAIAILGAIFSAIIPLVLKMFGKFEIFFVNNLGLPFNSGTIFTVLLLAGAFGYGLWYTRKKQKPLWNTLILSVIFILLGYSTFIMLAIRSNANTPIDENNPEDAMSLLAYYNREQYGSFPVLYGQYFNAPLDRDEPFKDGNPVYRRDDEKGEYVVSDDRKNSVRNFADSHTGFFPRMWNEEPASIRNYKKLANLKDPDAKPPFDKNLKFFFDYQIGHMWWRYFMWNFAGRQNDEQHRYEKTKGNWLSGIDFIDRMRLGPQKDLPYHMRNNPARNLYFFLPFILGLVGLYYHYKKDQRNAWVVSLIFLFTGLAIAVYLNHKPFEPRERDYAYVGSFYAYSMWVGLGVMAIYELMKDKLKKQSTAIGITAACTLAVPVLMAKENWDDHDRSDRYVARDIAKAYLDSCEKNAILFTNGDNDTFPLWYVQEVEGYRTDVRVVNLSLLNTSWYIDQQKRAAYEADPVPFSLEHDQYKQGTRDVLYYQDRGANPPWNINQFMRWIKRDDQGARIKAYGQKEFMFYPVKRLTVPINKQEVLNNNVVPPQDTGRILNQFNWKLKGNILSKRDMMVVDLLSQNDWSRPIYFSVTVGNSKKSFFNLTDHFRLEGLAYRLVPLNTQNRGGGSGDFGDVDVETMYRNLTQEFAYGNMEQDGVYLDETNRRVTYNLRNIFGRLGQALADRGDTAKAVEVLDMARAKMPEDKFEYNYFVFGMIEGYYKANATDKARDMINHFADRLDEQLAYYAQFSTKERRMVDQEIKSASSYYQMLVRLVAQYELGGMNNPQQLQQSEIFNRFQSATQPFGMAGPGNRGRR